VHTLVKKVQELLDVKDERIGQLEQLLGEREFEIAANVRRNLERSFTEAVERDHPELAVADYVKYLTSALTVFDEIYTVDWTARSLPPPNTVEIVCGGRRGDQQDQYDRGRKIRLRLDKISAEDVLVEPINCPHQRGDDCAYGGLCAYVLPGPIDRTR